MDAKELLKMATDLNAQKAAEVRGKPSLAEMLGRAKRLSHLIGALCQVFDEGVLPNTKRTLAECEELAFALRSDIARLNGIEENAKFIARYNTPRDAHDAECMSSDDVSQWPKR